HSSFFGHVSKCAVSVVVVKGIARGNPAVVQVAAVDEINVLPPITIKVADADARPELLAVDRNPVIPFEVDEPDPGRISDFGKANRSGWGLCLREDGTIPPEHAKTNQCACGAKDRTAQFARSRSHGDWKCLATGQCSFRPCIFPLIARGHHLSMDC